MIFNSFYFLNLSAESSNDMFWTCFVFLHKTSRGFTSSWSSSGREGKQSTQYVLSNSRQSNSISLSSHHHPPSFPIWFNRSNSPSVSTLLLSLAPVLLLFIFYPIRGLFDGTMSTTLCSKLIPNIAIYLAFRTCVPLSAHIWYESNLINFAIPESLNFVLRSS